MKKETILIVDDIETNIDILVELLEKRYPLQVALNGKDALSSVKKTLPDLILLDIMMPEMDGFEVCSRLKQDERTCEIPIIFITANSDIESIVMGFNVGGADYVTKPFITVELLARVEVQLKVYKQQKYLKSIVKNQAINLQKALRKIEEATKENTNLDHLKDDFIETVFHTLNSPLTSILGYSEMLRDMGHKDKSIESFTEIIHEESLHLEKLSKDIIELSCLVSNKKEYNIELLQLNSIISGVLEKISTDSQEGAKSRIEVLCETIQFEGDSKKIPKVIQILLDNAVKFSTTIASPITISTKKTESSFSLSISNEGVILPEEERKKVFDRFYQYIYPGEKIQGAGIGLAIAEGIIKFHQGKIWTEPSSNGMVFTFSLPLLQAQD